MIKLERERLITPKFDLVFKRVYGSEDNNIAMKVLIKEVLNITPKKITILNSELIGTPYVDKKVYVDLIVELEDKTKVIIEVNTEVDTPLQDRNLFYMCRIMARDLRPGQHYDEFNKHILVDIDFSGKHEKPIMDYKLIDEKTGKIFSEKLQIITIDIPYYSKKCYTNREDVSKLTRLEKFLGLFNIDDRKLAWEVSRGDKDMEEIYNKIKECNLDDEILGAYDGEWHRQELERLGKIRAEKEGFENGYDKGIEKGLEQGKLENSKEIVKNMLKENIDIELISKITGMSIEDIKKIF